MPSDSTDKVLAAAVLRRDRAERRHALITATVDSELPIAATVTGTIFFLFGIADGIMHPSEAGWRVASSEVPALLLVVCAWLAWRRLVPVRWASWTYGAMVLVAISSTILTVAIGKRAEELVFTLLILAAAGAAVPTYPVYITVVSVTAIGYWTTLASLHLKGDGFGHWFNAGAVATAASVYVLMSRRRSLTALVDAERNIENMAVSDNLTNAFNRNGIRMMGKELLALAGRQRASVFAVFIDVDGLKAVNDTAGHEAGDMVLQLVSAQLGLAFRKGDLVGRWGGDEFVVLGMGMRLDPDVIEARVVAALQVHPERPSAWPPSLSAGIAVAVEGDVAFDDVDELIAQADHDMYRRRGDRRRR